MKLIRSTGWVSAALIVALWLNAANAQVLDPNIGPPSQPPSQEAESTSGNTFRANANYTWTPEAARDESFKDVKWGIDPKLFNGKDPELEDNLRARLGNETEVGNKVLAYFANGDYCYYYKGEFESYCYHSNGQLFSVSISNSPMGKSIFPDKMVKYGYPSGEVVQIVLSVARGESFSFSPDGKLIVHWKGRTAYDASGQVITHRHWVDEKTANDP